MITARVAGTDYRPGRPVRTIKEMMIMCSITRTLAAIRRWITTPAPYNSKWS